MPAQFLAFASRYSLDASDGCRSGHGVQVSAHIRHHYLDQGAIVELDELFWYHSMYVVGAPGIVLLHLESL